MCVVAGTLNGALCLWTMPPLKSAAADSPAVDGRVYNLPGGHSQCAVVHVTLYAGCKRFVSAAEDGVIIVWDADAVRPMARMQVMNRRLVMANHSVVEMYHFTARHTSRVTRHMSSPVARTRLVAAIDSHTWSKAVCAI